MDGCLRSLRVDVLARVLREDPCVTSDLFDTAPIDFTCPRCERPTSDRFYGPCTDCRSTLRALIANDARSIEAEAYEPKMNVVPNSVATKD